MTHRILLDVDTGTDDALAIMFAVKHPDIDVRAITCVDGNTTLPNVVSNTLRILDVLEAPEIPVAAGATRPLVAEPSELPASIHGNDGLADLPLPPSARALQPVHAVELMRRELLASDKPLTIVPVGPLTNIALLLRMHPELAPRIGRIVFMGGSAWRGNMTPTAEFNVHHDPEAAHIVLTSGVPLTMYGLDVFEIVAMDPERIEALGASPAHLHQTAAALLRYHSNRDEHGTIGDAGALCALVRPGLFTFEEWPVQVELHGAMTRGQTVVDRRVPAPVPADGRPPALVSVALDADIEGVVRLFLETIGAETAV